MNRRTDWRIPAVFLAVLVARPALAQWTTDGIPVCTVPKAQTTASSDYPLSSLVADGAEGAFIAWSDNRRTGRSDVYLQHLQPDGLPAPGWPVNGMAVDTSASQAYLSSIAADGAGGVILAWSVGRPQNAAQQPAGIYGQRILATGVVAPGWSDQGTLIKASVLPDGFSIPNGSYGVPVADGEGGAIFIWTDRELPGTGDVWAQHITVQGNRASGWPENGIALSVDPAIQSGVVAVSDGAGGAIATWRDARNTSYYHIYAQRITADGLIPSGWPANGLPVCTAGTWQDQPVIAADGVGGAVIAWRDIRSGDVYESEIYAQRVQQNGTIAPGWQIDGNPVCTALRDQYGPSIASDGTDGALISWIDFRSGAHIDSADVYLQKLTLDGASAPGWPANGVPVCTAPGRQSAAQAIADGAGGAIVTWADRRSGLSSDIYAQHVLTAGSADGGWAVNGVPVCSAPSDQYGQWADSDGNGGIIVAWNDLRNGPYGEGFDIYAARVFSDGRTPVLTSLVSAEADPEAVRLTWWSHERGRVRVFRREAERDWMPLATVSADAGGLVKYEDLDVEPGKRYGYRLGITAESSDERFVGETWIEVPNRFGFALHGAWPNPSDGDLLVSFSLPVTAPATLELVDLSGRLLQTRRIAPRHAGSHVLPVQGGSALRPGIYLVRLSQGSRSITTKVSLIR